MLSPCNAKQKIVDNFACSPVVLQSHKMLSQSTPCCHSARTLDPQLSPNVPHVVSPPEHPHHNSGATITLLFHKFCIEAGGPAGNLMNENAGGSTLMHDVAGISWRAYYRQSS